MAEHENPGHAGKCQLDFGAGDGGDKFLICALDNSHTYNLAKALNRSTVLTSLYSCGQLRAGGWAERIARDLIADEARKEAEA